ncbi:lysosomal acid glucosylceramidase-like [Neodiprion pinetum]|uniref:lysosomal acid glucosylceramidase-like n=1 Tax=Neodiprion pinetum TaxID=441929 RepID=UPI001EDCFEFD|nr:lysosomal acid glucosylceramidase-like [Neodiprion pinetum]
MWRCILLLVACVYTTQTCPCVRRNFGNDRIVCVCNATYCDNTQISNLTGNGSYLRYTSSQDGLRLEKTQGDFVKEWTADLNSFQIDPDTTYQSIEGFGGTFSDAAILNIKTLSSDTQENLMRSYFTTAGSNYYFARVPIGSTDSSIRPYTYDDHSGDVGLERFSLAVEDLLYRIPLMKKAQEMNPEIKFLSAAWTAPPWMRTNHNYTGYGFLEEKYYQVYADYLVKYLNKYEDYGLKMWAISTGNEPYIGTLNLSQYGSMGWLPSDLGKWVANNFGPTIRKSKHKRTLILTYDDERTILDPFVDKMFENELARNYTAGLAIHGYADTVVPTSVLDEIMRRYPEKFLIMTEFSTETSQRGNVISFLGSWSYGESYVLDIIQNLKNWVIGWVDWSLAVDEYGGPDWRQNFVGASIIVNSEADEFYKQPMYYAIAHFSKFITPGSVRVGLTGGKELVKAAAFKTPKNEIVVVMYNNCSAQQNVIISDKERGQIRLQLPAKSIHTIMYK